MYYSTVYKTTAAADRRKYWVRGWTHEGVGENGFGCTELDHECMETALKMKINADG